MKHYHISWTRGNTSKLDWKTFQTEQEAEKEAQSLRRPGETYCIVEQDSDCPRCIEFKREAESRSAKS